MVNIVEKTKRATKSIEIKGARQNNLKNVDLTFPQNQLVVITGVSGSGKSSLAFDTLFAEGQRRYIESLSAYVRQFVGKIEKPEVDYIKGLSPSIAIQQKVNTNNPRSTVGTTTEIYDYLKLLFARAGKTFSPISGKEVKRQRVSDVIDALKKYPLERAVLLSPILKPKDRSLKEELNIILQKGFSRVLYKERLLRIEEVLDFIEGDLDDKGSTFALDTQSLKLVVDRVVLDFTQKENEERIADSIQTAFFEGGGNCLVNIHLENGLDALTFSNQFQLDGLSFEEPSPNLFTFNNPYGACKTCEGFGTVIGIDEDKVVPDKTLSVFDGAIACWKGDKMQDWKDWFIKNSATFNFPIHRPYFELSKEEKELLWGGSGNCEGINQFFEYLQSKAYKIQYRVLISRYKGKTNCPDCQGTRLRKDANYVKISGQGISDLVTMPIDELDTFIREVKLDEYQKSVSKRILVEVSSRITFLLEVGLGYLTLNRDARTLSGGESQRIQLVTSLGSNLTGSMYILDEPSIGLHSKDTEKLIRVLKNLRDLRNTVIVVEHDEDIIKEADYVIDVGPFAGKNGGEIVFSGDKFAFDNLTQTLTAKYMRGDMVIDIPKRKSTPKSFIEIKQAYKHNLDRIDVSIPLYRLSVITGVSGSGKSTLIKEVLVPSLQNKLRNPNGDAKNCLALQGDFRKVKQIEYVDQNPIGRSSRSNPVTYIKAYDGIRSLYASQQLAKQRGYTPAYFSFNVDGGRCDTCKGDGYLTIEMQFMADLHLSCEECKGRRFKQEILDIEIREKNIADVLEMTVDEALEFFKEQKDIFKKLKILQDVGLGYLGLGQPSNTLSGGEAQRIKLAYFLTEGSKSDSIFFIFDEPTTGLHFHDINHLLTALYKLIENGHSVLVIEHNMEVIKCADWLIDLGPDGGKNGGKLLYQGPPEGITRIHTSHTAKFLNEKMLS